MSGSRGGRSTYSFRIQAEGFQEFVADLHKIAGESVEAQRAIDLLVRSSPQLASSMQAAADATERAAKRVTEMREAQDRVGESARGAVTSVGGLSTVLGEMEGKTQAARRAAGDFRGALELLGATGLAEKLGPVSGFIGNFSDLFGTAELAATRFEGVAGLLSSRLASLAGLVAVPLFLQSVGLGINQAGEASQSATASMDQWRETLLRLNPTLEQTAARANAATDAIRRANLADAERSYGVILDRRSTAIGRLPEIDGQLVQAERAAADAEARAVSLTVQAGADATNPILRNRNLLGASSMPEADRAARAAAEARERVTALRNERLQYEGEIQRLGGASNEFMNLRSALQGPIYGEPAGPDAPASAAAAPAVAGRGGRDTSARDEAALEREFERADTLARRAAERTLEQDRRAQTEITRTREREESTRVRAAERSTDQITRYLSDGLAQSYREAGGGFQGLLRGMQQAARDTPIRIFADALIRPAVSGAVNALGLGGDGATGGSFSQLLGFTGAANQVGNLVGLGGFGGGGGLAGLANTPLWGGNVAGPAFNGIAASGAPTLGALAGGIGGGFALGSILGGFTSGGSAARQTNSQIGSGAGALAGAAIGSIFPGIGTVLGGIIGGGLGGAGGGLIGPGVKTNAFGFTANSADGAFGLEPLRTTGDGAGGAEAYAAAEAQLAQVNALLAASGLTARDNRRAVTGGGRRPADGSQSANLTEALGTFRFESANSNVSRALSSRPTAGLEEALSITEFVTGTYAALSATVTPLSALQRELREISAVFDAARAGAERYGLAQDGLNARQAEAVALAQARSDSTVLGGLTQRARVLGGFLEGRARSTGSAQSQFGAARAQYETALDAARAAGPDSANLTGLVGSANAFLTANAAFNGGGAQAAAVEAAVRGGIIQLGGALDLPGFTDDLSGAIFRAGERQVDELKLLRDEVTGMREELRGIRLLSARG